MIYPQTILNIADNTGVKKIMCIRVLGNSKKYAKIGDIIVGVVKESTNKLIKKSEIVHAVIVRTKKIINRYDGTYIRFDDNAAVILNSDKNPKGSRILGPIAYEIRKKNFSKIISLASDIL
uniref:Ribosomal protein L14 n=1 Tax=Nitzschia sp. (in: diatoms) TaxID=1884248 RepID=A0A5J6DW18_9STRA|nr:ribosomal protein L14 [Nitzschia sp. (in: diatoms)]